MSYRTSFIFRLLYLQLLLSKLFRCLLFRCFLGAVKHTLYGLPVLVCIIEIVSMSFTANAISGLVPCVKYSKLPTASWNGTCPTNLLPSLTIKRRIRAALGCTWNANFGNCIQKPFDSINIDVPLIEDQEIVNIDRNCNVPVCIKVDTVCSMIPGHHSGLCSTVYRLVSSQITL